MLHLQAHRPPHAAPLLLVERGEHVVERPERLPHAGVRGVVALLKVDSPLVLLRVLEVLPRGGEEAVDGVKARVEAFLAAGGGGGGGGGEGAAAEAVGVNGRRRVRRLDRRGSHGRLRFSETPRRRFAKKQPRAPRRDGERRERAAEHPRFRTREAPRATLGKRFEASMEVRAEESVRVSEKPILFGRWPPPTSLGASTLPLFLSLRRPLASS